MDFSPLDHAPAAGVSASDAGLSARRGLLFESYNEHYGIDSGAVL